MRDVEMYEVFLRVADESDDCVYLVEHWFVDRPGINTISALFDEARRDFAVLYHDVDAEDFSVEVRRLRPRDKHRPDQEPPTWADTKGAAGPATAGDAPPPGTGVGTAMRGGSVRAAVP